MLRWESYLALVKRLEPEESTGYGRRFVAERPTWIGIVPVGYADGFRRDLTGTEVVVGGSRCRVVGTVSMDAFAVELPEQLVLAAGRDDEVARGEDQVPCGTRHFRFKKKHCAPDAYCRMEGSAAWGVQSAQPRRMFFKLSKPSDNPAATPAGTTIPKTRMQAR